MTKIPLLELWNVSKFFPGVVANDSVNLKLHTGEILALLGENGAGKSTLVKMIYGVTHPSQGSIMWDNHEIEIHSPNQARAMGIGMVFQHFSVFETLTVLENIELGLDPEFLHKIDNLKQKVLEISQRYDLQVDPDRYVHHLSIGERQRLEILRCLIQDIRLLILDEPTSVLTPQEVSGLFRVLRKLASEGCSILFISHKLKEVTELCDRAVILRGGKVTGECIPAQETPNSIARMMVGSDAELSESYPKSLGGQTLLQTKALTLSPTHPFGCGLTDVNLEMRSGEILGIAGVAGNGQEDLLEALSGEDHRTPKESIFFHGKPVGHLHAGTRRALGMAYVPTNRLGQGAVPEMSLEENTLLTHTAELTRFGFIQQKLMKTLARKLIRDNQVKCRNEQAQAKSLSGGNLQKFIIGREVNQHPAILICAHPTWGVDIGAASAIHRQLIALRDAGAAIIVISEDIDELFVISDRLAAIYEGHVSPIVKTNETNIEQIGQWIAGGFLKHEEIANA
ncbi:ABC transporter ATP-binding protein [Vibrio mangrovi]|uniref:ABC transporter ATP-binding protein n=1 Tax=Vibrio mangrovi TaxID=474394 RepID=A0A1Y6IT05_9VIBR|nr:ABC transporter ATP-binding protein [Vibrio mangrovi]MDW6004499.1 ABC transporter ATP-binding protein [Vibrio mangrovi]SMS00787.1 Galactose/methyl galactoside import ATP-binding protein MglA [Vibrio mangrovi]